MREIEIKLKVKNLNELEKKLTDNGCAFSESIKQDDMVYSNMNINDYFDGKEGIISMRIRKEDNKTKLTLKQQKSNEMDNIEYETEVKDAEEVNQMLLLLGWKLVVQVVKNRKKGKLGEYEVCLDSVEKLGSYIELEKLTDDNANPDKIRKELFEALKPFGLSEIDEETKGYDTQIYLLNKK